MLKWLGKMVAEKIVGMVVLLLAIGVVVLVWRYHQHLPSWGSVGHFFGCVLVWVAAAALLPWATFFVIGWVQRAGSNLPAVGLLLGWGAVDGLLAWWLAGGAPTAGRWFATALAFCLAGLYNLIVANQIANRLEGR